MSGEEAETEADVDVGADEPEPDAPAASEAATANAKLFGVWDVTEISYEDPSTTRSMNVTPIVPEHPPAQLASSRQKPTNERGDGSTHCKRAVPYVLQPGLQKIMSTPWIVLRKARAKMVANSNSANRILNH